MLRDGLTRHGQLLAEGGCRSVAIRQEQVDHPSPGRVPDCRPKVVVDNDSHWVETSCVRYSPRRGRWVSQPTQCCLYCSSRTAASQPISRNPVSVSRTTVPAPDGTSSKVTSSELA